jgi:hypothetical protein
VKIDPHAPKADGRNLKAAASDRSRLHFDKLHSRGFSYYEIGNSAAATECRSGDMAIRR